MLSFALAVGAVAAGIGLAAVGMALLIGAVDEASFGAVAGASVIFIGIGTGAYFMAGGLAAAAVKAGVAGTALLPLGGAIALVGLGVGLAAAGMAELVKSFNGFDATEIVAIGAAMLGFSVSLYAVASSNCCVRESADSRRVRLSLLVLALRSEALLTHLVSLKAKMMVSMI